MPDARKWVDRTGRTRWQPLTDDALMAWLDHGDDNWDVHWAKGGTVPKLYRSRSRAQRVAGRRERYQLRSCWMPADERDDDA